MFLPALLTFSISTVLFMLIGIVVQAEQFRARRFFLAQNRASLDVQFTKTGQRWRYYWNHFTQYIVKLGWYYGMHSLLRTILNLLVSMYSYVEDRFERNRKRTKKLRQERKRRTTHTHFTQIASHKVETALTPSQQHDLRTKKLEQDH